MSKKAQDSATIALNKKAYHEYTIEETIEAGISLEGWEAKSLRAGRAQITECYARILNNEAWMIGGLITPLGTVSTHFRPQPDRSRKLLLHRKEIDKISGYIQRKGYTLVILALYWKSQRVKVKLGLAKGKQTHDKRAALKERDWKLQKQRNLKER